MGYRIKKLPYKRRSWKLQFISYKNNQVKIQDIAETDYLSIGFKPSMSLEEAIERKNQLNARAHNKFHEEKRAAILTRLKAEKSELNFPQTLVREFESNLSLGQKDNKIFSHWRAAQRVIAELDLEPVNWFKNSARFYAKFVQKTWSLSYTDKVLGLINKWGDFVTEHYGQRFKPIPYPTGTWQQRILDTYFDKNGGMESLPLRPEQLESAKSTLKPEHYNWLYLSIWLGLRPSEIDQLLLPSSSNTWWIETRPNGTILWLYQTKLTSISRNKRAKPIPLIFAEQQQTITIINSGKFKRPLTKTLKHHIGPKYTCYAGRKGFVDLMLGRGRKLEEISIWLGHQSIERTWRNYKNKQLVSF
jgi:hypothetical protein